MASQPSLKSRSIALTESEKRLLGLLFKHGAMTQADLAEATNLTQQSASRIAGKLTESALLREGAKIATGRRGYPSTALELEPRFAFSFGLSLMDGAASLALIDFSGSILAEVRTAFVSMPTKTVLDWLGRSVAALSQRHLGRDANIAGIGVGVAGSHVGDGKGFNTPLSLEEWAGKDIGGLVSDAVGLPAWADNDGNVAAIGESMVGVGRWASSFAYLYISSGVGGGVVLDGKLWRGRHGNAGEFAGGLPPNIFPFPNLELLRQLVVRQGVDLPSINELIDQFDPEWPAIDDWIARVRDSLSIIASNATAILDVEVIVLGGRMPKALAERVIPHIELYDQRRRLVPRPTARLSPAEAPGDAAALGAAVLPLKHTYFAYGS